MCALLGRLAMAVVMMAWLGAVLLAVQQPETLASPGTESNQQTILYTSIIGIASMLATQFFALWKESRNRRWDQEDRAAARRQMQKNAEAQLEETVQTAIVLARVTEAHREHILEELSKNTEITLDVGAKADAAYTAANNFTERMEALRRELNSKGTQIDHIEETSDAINEKVTDIKEGK